MNVPVKSKNFLSIETLPETTILGIVLVLAILAFLPGLGSYRMLDPTDSFFQEAAREMMELKHYVTPLFNYSDWLDKPALPFLLIILSYKIFGISAWAARLPSALSGILLVVGTYWSVKKFLGRPMALGSAVVLCSSPLFSIVGHVALTDEPLALFWGMAMFGFAQRLILKETNSLFLAYGGLILAILCKGPIGLVLSGGIIVLYLLITSQSLKDIWQKIVSLKPLLGTLALIIGCLPYYALAHATTNGAFTQAFFLRQNLGRFTGTVNHQEPFWWYIPVFMGGFFPWTIYLITGGDWFKELWKNRQSREKKEDFLIFCCTWVVFVLVLFSAIPTKLPTYIVLLSPALSIIVSAYLQYWFANKNRSLILITGIILLVCAIAGMIVIPKIIPVHREISFLIFFAVVVTSMLLTLHSILVFTEQLDRAKIVLLISAYLSCSVLVPLSFCQFYDKYQAGLDRLIKVARDRNLQLATLYSPVPSAIFSYGRKIENIDTLPNLAHFCKTTSAPRGLLARANCLSIAELRAKEHTLDSVGRWYLLSVDNYLKEQTSLTKPVENTAQVQEP